MINIKYQIATGDGQICNRIGDFQLSVSNMQKFYCVLSQMQNPAEPYKNSY